MELATYYYKYPNKYIFINVIIYLQKEYFHNQIISTN